MMKKLIFVLTCLLLAAVCDAEIIIVDDDWPYDFNNVQAAINYSADGDIIVVFPGKYTGDGNRDIDFDGKAVTVQSVDPQDPYIVAATIIDCNGLGRGFYFHSGEDTNSVVDGLTITNGNADLGGGIYFEGENAATISNCTITQNAAALGGGIYCDLQSQGCSCCYIRQCTPRIINCVIMENTALFEGGGVYCNSGLWGCGPMFCWEWHSCRIAPLISDCFIFRNTAEHGDGGGVYYTGDFWNQYCKDSPMITNSTISSNSARENGGGICCWAYSNPAITSCTFNGNTAAGNGGGIWCGYNATITNCTINGNSADGDGGGVCGNREGDINHHKLTINNCTFSSNLAGSEGGGVWGINLSITNSAFSANTAGVQSGGIFACELLLLTNSILWGNADASGIVEYAQVFYASHYFNPEEHLSDVISSCIQDDNPNDVNVPFGGADSGNIDDDPLFVRNPDDGGDGWEDDPCTPEDESANNDFGDLHLQVDSPCINAGLPDFITDPNTVDMDGEGRILGGRVDMGADEFAPIIVVTKPQGGEVWVNESTHKIEWLGHGVDLVDILFSEDAGSNWQIIESGLTDTDSYNWDSPAAVDSNRCVISVVPSVPDVNVVCLESGLFTIGPDFYHPDVPSKWKSLGGDFRRTGLSSDYGPEIGCIKWQFEPEGAVSASVTIGAGNRVHIASEDGKIYTLDSDGDLIWSYDTNSPLLSSPTIGQDGSVYVGAENGKLYAISIAGTLRWTHDTGGFICSSPAVSDDGNIYVGSQDGTLYALGPHGSELWSFKTNGFGILDGAILASPAIAADGTVYIGGLYDPNLYALDANDGSVKWVCNFECVTDPCDPANSTKTGWPFASPVVAPDGTIYQTLLYDPNLYAIEPNNGNIIWSTNLADPCYVHAAGWSEPVLGPDGTIYVAFDDPYLRAVDPNGSIKWVTQLGTMGGFTLTVASNGLIYAVGDDGCIYLVNPNGEEIAKFCGDKWLNFPVIPADNTIIVSDGRDNTMLITDANNTVWAIGPDDCEGKPFILYWREDLNTDGDMSLLDLALLAADWLDCTDPDGWYCYPSYPDQPTYLTGDINRDLYVDFADFAALANRWLNKE